MIDLEPYYTVIGKVVVNFQNLEHHFKQIYDLFTNERLNELDKKEIRFSKFLETLEIKVKEKCELGTEIVESICYNR